MTVPSQTPRNLSTAAPGATSFPYDFKILEASHLLVQVDGVTKTLNVDYTVDGVGDDAGGDMTFFVPLTGGESVLRKRNMPFARSIDYQQLGDFGSATMNNDQDAPVMMIQQVADDLAAAIEGSTFEAVQEAVDAAVSASASAASATASEASATASKDAAALSAASASASADAAAVSADAAAASGRIYADTTAGLAASTDGQYFYVPSGSADESLILYVRTDGTTATEVKRLPAASTVAALANATYNSLDLLTDRESPFFVDVWGYTKSCFTGSVFTEATVASRDSDTQLTVETGAGARFPMRSAVAILDGTTGRTKSYAVKSQAGDVLQFFETLPANPTKCQPMHDSFAGQHLSRLGYKGLADYVVDQVQKYAYKKDDVLFEYHPPITMGLGFSNPDVYALDGVTKLVDMTAVGGAAGGGFVSGTTNLSKQLTASSANGNISTDPPTEYYQRGYVLQDGVAGRGFSFTFSVGKRDGFLEIPISGRRLSYTSSVDGLTYYTDGQYRVEVIGDGSVTLHDQNYNSGQLKFLFIPFTGVSTIMVRVTLVSSVPTAVYMQGCYAYGKSPSTPTSGFFKTGDVIAFLGDSWTQFPIKVGAEVPPLRADGSTADGMCFLSERLRERLAADGITVTTQNMGRSGTTSEWGKYWISKILELSPRPTHCFINFGINDYNSIAAYTSTPNADSAYDFDPANMWASKFKSAGGKQGMLNNDLWFANLQYMCNRLLAAGIKPIVLMPAHTASASQAQGIRDKLLCKIGVGFRNTNEAGGGE